jgi:hypothetical protein
MEKYINFTNQFNNFQFRKFPIDHPMKDSNHFRE